MGEKFGDRPAEPEWWMGSKVDGVRSLVLKFRLKIKDLNLYLQTSLSAASRARRLPGRHQLSFDVKLNLLTVAPGLPFHSNQVVSAFNDQYALGIHICESDLDCKSSRREAPRGTPSRLTAVLYDLAASVWHPAKRLYVLDSFSLTAHLHLKPVS